MLSTEGNKAYLTFGNDDSIEIYVCNPDTASENHFWVPKWHTLAIYFEKLKLITSSLKYQVLNVEIIGHYDFLRLNSSENSIARELDSFLIFGLCFHSLEKEINNIFRTHLKTTSKRSDRVEIFCKAKWQTKDGLGNNLTLLPKLQYCNI